MITRLQYHWFRPAGSLPFFGRCAEVGVFAGQFSVTLLKKPAVTKLFLVDPYDYGQNEAQAQQSKAELEKAKRTAHRRVARFGTKAQFMYLPSLVAVNQFSNIDCVYIDADHTYEEVRKDIAAWWPKISPGGMMAGHDFYYSWPGVIRAVTEFAVNNNLILHVESPDWWIYKK